MQNASGLETFQREETFPTTVRSIWWEVSEDASA